MSTKRMPRWPLAIIAAPAAVSIWAGWVGLGQLCGFGPVHLLPGIDDHVVINTAVTLPVGIEAYAAYALGAWLSPGTSERARKFAKRSALGALALGMAGQVAFHLLSAAHASRAPWPVVTLVACLPVAVMGLGTALAHLLRDAAGDVPAQVAIPTGESASEAVADADVDAAVPVVGDVDVPVIKPVSVPPRTVPPVTPATARQCRNPRARSRGSGRAPKSPERVFATELAAGQVPSLRAVKTKLHLGTDKARVVRDELAAILSEGQPEAA